MRGGDEKVGKRCSKTYPIRPRFVWVLFFVNHHSTAIHRPWVKKSSSNEPLCIYARWRIIDFTRVLKTESCYPYSQSLVYALYMHILRIYRVFQVSLTKANFFLFVNFFFFLYSIVVRHNNNNYNSNNNIRLPRTITAVINMEKSYGII